MSRHHHAAASLEKHISDRHLMQSFISFTAADDYDDKSMSDATGMTGESMNKLLQVAQKQAEMVSSLTTNNMANAAELERMRELNDRLHMSFASTLTSYSVDDNDKSALPVLKNPSIGCKSSKKGGNEQKAYADPLPERTGIEQRNSCASRCWASFAVACTFFVPNFLICRPNQGAKQAWREKIAICAIVVFVSAVIVGLFGVAPLFYCKEASTYTFQDIWAKDREAWTVVHGMIYDMKEYVSIHPGGSGGIVDWLGKDSSKMFPRTPPAFLSDKCLNPEKDLTNYTEVQCLDMTALDELIGYPCHKEVSKEQFRVDKWLGHYEVGQLAFNSRDLLLNSQDWDWIVIQDRVYNVTNYVRNLRDTNSGKITKDPSEIDDAYLSSSLHALIVNKLNQDATDLYSRLYENDDYLDCMDELFYVGVVDARGNDACRALNLTMSIMLIFIVSMLLLQCLCSLLYLARPHRSYTAQDGNSLVMIMVPCYNEGDNELRKTIQSIAQTNYPSENKVMVLVADGNITGKGERLSTRMILSKILGFEIDEKEDGAFSYKSLGACGSNRCNIYSGVYENQGKSLKYVVVVKCGTESEFGSARAGNRGKRDSQLIVTGMFNRIHHGRQLFELDSAIAHSLKSHGIRAREVEYLMTIDADTRIHADSIQHMVWNMNKNEKILALCGETQIENKAQSLITMLQVFEYYINHHMKKAFESVFGCVTCLPGCFTMYRTFTSDGRSLIAQDDVFSEYARNDIETLHEKNLYHLGEDRMLTTLLLKNFPDMRLSFVPEAICWTIVPHAFYILLSQRRRWINSTFHNLVELLKVDTMCGVCFLSMKTTVVIDLIATMILPAGLVYLGYFVYLVVATGEDISTLLLILYGVTFGVQILSFFLRSRWDMFFFFLVFVIAGVPLFYFILPIYSFAMMDDFSWGATRQVRSQKTIAKEGSEKGDSLEDENALEEPTVESLTAPHGDGNLELEDDSKNENEEQDEPMEEGVPRVEI